MTENETEVLKSTIDQMCTSVSFLDNFPTAEKSKLIQFSVEFCDNYGVTKDSVDVVLEARMTEDQKRELFIEVSGLLVETITYDSEMVITDSVTSSDFESMYLHYYSDIVDISAVIILKEIYQDSKLQFPEYMCSSREASIIQKNTQFLLDNLDKKTHQTKTMFTNLFDVKHTNNVAMFMMMANKCTNLNPVMKDIAKQVYKLNNINK